MITSEIQDRIAKIYELVNRGATEGERNAAKHQLDKLMKKYNLNDAFLNDIHLKSYRFNYGSKIDQQILMQIIKIQTVQGLASCKQGTKYIIAMLPYMEFVTVDCMYEYYRRHAKIQWAKFCKPELSKCRKAKTKTKRRNELQGIFLSNYIIASGLYRESDLKKVDPTKMSDKEYKDRMMLDNVEGGVYNKQVHSHLLLEN